MHYTALQNYSVTAGHSPTQKAPDMAATYSISASTGELMVPENAGVVIQAKSGINAIRVSGTATTAAGITGTGTTANQIQFYSNDTIVGAFDQNGLYFPEAKSNILSLGSFGSLLCNSISTIGNNNLLLTAAFTTSGSNPAIVFYVQNPVGTNGGLGSQQAGYINNIGMYLNSTCPLNANGGVRIDGPYAPSFSAYTCNNANLGVNSLSTWTNTDWNIGNAWNGSRFTCPSTGAGVYQVIVSIAPATTNCVIATDIRVNGTSTRLITSGANVVSNLYGSVLMRLNANDYVELWVTMSINQGTNNTTSLSGSAFHTFFQMCWLRSI